MGCCVSSSESYVNQNTTIITIESKNHKDRHLHHLRISTNDVILKPTSIDFRNQDDTKKPLQNVHKNVSLLSSPLPTLESIFCRQGKSNIIASVSKETNPLTTSNEVDKQPIRGDMRIPVFVEDRDDSYVHCSTVLHVDINSSLYDVIQLYRKDHIGHVDLSQYEERWCCAHYYLLDFTSRWWGDMEYERAKKTPAFLKEDINRYKRPFLRLKLLFVHKDSQKFWTVVDIQKHVLYQMLYDLSETSEDSNETRNILPFKKAHETIKIYGTLFPVAIWLLIERYLI
jgi:hypothetical protein